MLLSLFLIVVLASFILFGLWFGFVHTLGALLGTVLSAFVAGRMFEPVAAWIHGLSGWDENVLRVGAFLIIFVVLNRIIGFGFYLLERMFRFLQVIPFLATIDHLLGAIAGFLEGVIVLGLTLFVAAKFPIGSLALAIRDSSIALWLMKTSSILLPLLPEVVRQYV